MDELINIKRDDIRQQEPDKTFRVNDCVRSHKLSDHEIRINFLSTGCVVSVGCRQIPFLDVHAAMLAVNKYVDNPKEETERWENIFNKQK